jgi:hypothetical protein
VPRRSRARAGRARLDHGTGTRAISRATSSSAETPSARAW